MTTAKEVLTRLAAPEVEPHIVIGADRSVTVPTELRNIAVQFDHNIETVVFDCPRYWDDNDLSAMRVFINYARPDGKIGQFPCTDVSVDDSDSSIMHFSWTISGHATEVNGALSFLVCVKASEDDGTLKNRWSSHLNQDMIVAKGMDASDEITSFHPDILVQILERLENIENIEALGDKDAILERINILENEMRLDETQDANMLARIGTLEEGVDWDQNDPESSSYIPNRPIYLKERSVSWDGQSEEQYMSADHPSAENLVGGTVMVMSKGVNYEYPTVACCSTQAELDTLKASQTIVKYAYVTVGELLRSTIVGQLPGIEYILWLSDVENPGGTVYYFNDPDVDHEPGLYCTKLEETDDSGNVTYRYPTELTWYEPTVDPRYKVLFDEAPSDNNTSTTEPTVTAISITEASDGTVTIVNTLSDGAKETVAIGADADGNPASVTVNGTAIPVEWTVETA